MSDPSSKSGSRKRASKASCSSHYSRGSAAVITAAVMARAEAEATKAEIAFAGRESELKIQQAQLEASLKALQLEKRAAAIQAKAEALETAAELGNTRKSSLMELSTEDATERTQDYILKQIVDVEEAEMPVLDGPFYDNKDKRVSGKQQSQSTPFYVPQEGQSALYATPSSFQAVNVESIQNPAFSQSIGMPLTLPSRRKAFPQPPKDVPHTYAAAGQDSGERSRDRQVPHDYFQTTPSTHLYANNQMSDVVRFIARRELVSTGLTQFNDQPENFRAWRASFLNVTKDLDLSPSEEMDLLVRWLGCESAEQARRIRAVHINYPAQGLKLIWKRLYETYGSPEMVESSLFRKLENFPKISNRDNCRLRELGDLLMEIQAAMQDGDLMGLSYLDTARGVNPIIQKLPFNLQEKWLTVGSKYKEDYSVSFPPFEFLVDFVCQQAKMRNDPSFSLTTVQEESRRPNKQLNKSVFPRAVATHKTQVSSENSSAATEPKNKINPAKHCFLHEKPHPLSRCRGFRMKSMEQRKLLLKQQGICFKCCSSISHMAKNCDEVIKCSECGSTTHIAALHPGLAPWATVPKHPGVEIQTMNEDIPVVPEVSSACTEVCGNSQLPRSCSKVCLVKVYPENRPEKAVKAYVILDDQSNRSLARPEFFDLFDITECNIAYTLKTCAGTMVTEGRLAQGFQVESFDGSVVLPLPVLLECNEIPDNRSEIPSPEVISRHRHLRHLARYIPRPDHHAPILLLLGRDIIRVHKAHKQVNGPPNAPFAQKLDLGWVIIGDMCLGKIHKPNFVQAYHTNILENGQCTHFYPCPNNFNIKEKSQKVSPSEPWFRESIQGLKEWDVFQRTKDDEKVALSIEDKLFLQIMDSKVYQDDENSWVAPLPFKQPRQYLPNNRPQAVERLNALKRSFRKKPEMEKDFVAFMESLFQNDHAETAAPVSPKEQCWYLPSFGVYHPRKPSQIRVVFDSSAQYKGVSLNGVLLSGPDLNNSLLGVLMRFRKDPVAFMVDIKQMFYCFKVRPADRDYLRFLWFRDNNPENEPTEYRMKVHVFGNSPSSAVAIYCLRRAAQAGEKEFGQDVRQFVEQDFYMDDGLKSLATPEMAISLLKRTQDMLANSNLKLHKLASNSKEVMRAFPSEDYANALKDLDIGVNSLPTQRSLGLLWNLDTDCFNFQVQNDKKPCTRRGLLSVINSLYDPLGFVAPVTVQGKVLLRELTGNFTDWDSPLPVSNQELWESWKNSLQDLQHVQVPRSYGSTSLSDAKFTELSVFSDASEKIIAAVAYLKTVDSDGNCHIGFIAGKARLAPRPELTIPRLELCAAVLAVNIMETITEEIAVKFDKINFYTDSRVVLGYIYNEERRFHVYVSNRIQRIRRSTTPDQWHYVSSEHNPADIATRPIAPMKLQNTIWFSGPAFLHRPKTETVAKAPYALVDPEQDVEIRTHVTVLNTTVSKRFERFSDWSRLIRAIGKLIHIACSYKQDPNSSTPTCKGWHCCELPLSTDTIHQSKVVVVKAIQREMYAEELQCLKQNKSLPKTSTLQKLDPFVDESGLLRIGGRLLNADLSSGEKRPLIIPGKSHVALLLIRHFHEQTHHQGRHLTEGAIRSAGYWIIGGKRRVSSLIHSCVVCRRLRRGCETQKMADLPKDRLSAEPPFTHVGIDVFGPWSVSARKTRGGIAENKRWAVLFTCLSIRAIHIEVIESLSTSSFINALRRFLAIRGPVKQIRSDRGTNFIGACKDLQISSNVDEKAVERFLSDQGCVWTFNPPHSSHMGGAWERMIGLTRKILDSMLLQTTSSKLTHEVLSTFMAEVTAIINNRPLIPVSTDPADPFILTPATLLTQKSGTDLLPPGNFEKPGLYKQQWRMVQSLASMFWDRWRKQYLATLQYRRKWQHQQPNVSKGCIVLLKDSQSKRNDWPLGIITETYPGQDGRVRKVQVRIIGKDGPKLFLRPINEMILLLHDDPKQDVKN
ncbi:uncharacterized protein LOC125740722 isoform X1 [Brienomyrus brachyistius]|uniref:uncharacterized protein LOC125740722 isoform X1 n=1 Tax=Brienomyrus brachyistius TaxID=42636 RepID=UPI0020B37F3D|nr:uncharacterized protein LOC125740722 isoform X1 [Brienomyrus brachyistius]